MQIYWTLRSIPELSGLPLGERMRVWRAAHWNIYRHWQFWASLVGMVLCMGIGRHIYDRIGGYIGAVVGEMAALSRGEAAVTTARQALSAVGLVATIVVTVFVTRLARRALSVELSDHPPVALHTERRR